MTHITCRLTAKNQDQLRNPVLSNRVRATFTFYMDAERHEDARNDIALTNTAI